MAQTQRTTAVGVFADRNQAQQAVAELRRAGFREDQIGVAGRDGDSISGTGDNNYAAEGAATGAAAGAGVGALWGMGIVAGLLPAIGPAIAGGTLAAILTSAVAGAAVAGLTGAMVGLGIPEDEAEYYEGEFRAGRTVVTVNAGNKYDQAAAILQRFQGYDFATSERSAMASGTRSGASY